MGGIKSRTPILRYFSVSHTQSLSIPRVSPVSPFLDKKSFTFPNLLLCCCNYPECSGIISRMLGSSTIPACMFEDTPNSDSSGATLRYGLNLDPDVCPDEPEPDSASPPRPDSGHSRVWRLWRNSRI